MKIQLLQSTPLYVCARAIRTCWQSQEKSDTTCTIYSFEDEQLIHNLDINSVDFEDAINIKIGESDKELIHRIGNKYKHKSTLEHLVYSFQIDCISRACLQEVARHRISSLSVKSTRYTLKELKDEQFENADDETIKKISKKYLVQSESAYVNSHNYNQLDNLHQALRYGNISNDTLKYMIPEAYKTSLMLTINARSLQNFLELRTSKSALWEIRNLAYALFEVLPEDHKYLFEEYLHENINTK